MNECFEMYDRFIESPEQEHAQKFIKSCVNTVDGDSALFDYALNFQYGDTTCVYSLNQCSEGSNCEIARANCHEPWFFRFLVQNIVLIEECDIYYDNMITADSE